MQNPNVLYLSSVTNFIDIQSNVTKMQMYINGPASTRVNAA